MDSAGRTGRRLINLFFVSENAWTFLNEITTVQYAYN